MKQKLKRISIIILIIISSLILLFGIYLLFSTITKFKPQAEENLEFKGEKTLNKIEDEELSVLSWNIGYCGLGKEMDFFYDGGKQVTPPMSNYQGYLNEVLNTINKYTYVDFMFLQEVDIKSKRSYFSNQEKLIAEFLPAFGYAFAKNYDVQYVIMPPTSPMGRVKAGLMSLTKYQPTELKRISYPSSFSWPKKLLMLDRCMLLARYPLTNGKALVMINTHNSAYDEDGTLRKVELEKLKTIITGEYAKGNYVLVGGDWNTNPPGFETKTNFKNDKKEPINPAIDINYMPKDWKWFYDNTIPSERFTDEPYIKGKTKTTIIDYFLASPNIELSSVRTLDLGFANSDHNPVLLNFKLLNLFSDTLQAKH